jgi:TAG lipase/lysophosphatidylethanolamine acyltransferase
MLNYRLWRAAPESIYYDSRLIFMRSKAIVEAHMAEDIMGLIAILRAGLVRNLGNITDHHLFSRAYCGTKAMIDEYVETVVVALAWITSYPTTAESQGGLTHQGKLDVLHDTRQAFGRTALVLQGGSIFGLCHIGVVKALHQQGLLPRIISGTATGALIAALVGVHKDDELLNFLTPEGIDLSAFNASATANGYNFEYANWFNTTVRRFRRFLKEGQLLDVRVLEACVKANVGNLTFEEAYHKTRRVLNITVPTTVTGVPMLLNYLKSPHVVSTVSDPWVV